MLLRVGQLYQLVLVESIVTLKISGITFPSTPVLLVRIHSVFYPPKLRVH